MESVAGGGGMNRPTVQRLRGVVRCEGCGTYVGRNLLAGDKYRGCCPVCGAEVEVAA